MVEKLLKHGVNLKSRFTAGKDHQMNVLMVTVHENTITDMHTHKSICKLLIDKGIDVHSACSDDCTPLMVAIDLRMESLARLLIEWHTNTR